MSNPHDAILFFGIDYSDEHEHEILAENKTGKDLYTLAAESDYIKYITYGPDCMCSAIGYSGGSAKFVKGSYVPLGNECFKFIDEDVAEHYLEKFCDSNGVKYYKPQWYLVSQY